MVELIYVSDGNYDAGHYDLVVKSPDQLAEIEEVYALWRERKVVELQNWNNTADNSSYGMCIRERCVGAELGVKVIKLQK